MSYPTYKGHWHRIPKWLTWLCLIPAAYSWAFDQSKIFYTAFDPETRRSEFIGRIYAFEFGYLMELHSGNWYIRIGSLK